MKGCIVRKNHEFYGSFQFQEYGEVDIRNTLISASRINLNTLIIDLDTAPATAILQALHTYRVQRPNTRIIILAQGRQPGDTEVAGVIALGIYDIVAPEDDETIPELERAISNPPATYSQAARWLRLEQSDKDDSAKSAGKPELKTEILIQQRPLGLTTIAVAGAGSGAGASHLCLTISSYLASNNSRVVLAEWPIGEKNVGVESQYSFLSPLGAKYERKKTHGAHGVDIKMAYLNGFDVFLDARSFRSIEYVFPVITQNSYDYLVLDLGELGPDSPEKVAEMDRAALAILTVNAAPYRIERFLPFVDEHIFAPNLSRWKIALNLATDKDIKWFLDTFSKYVGKVYPIPYMASIFEQPDSIKDILQPVLPTNVVARKKPFSWLRAIFKN